MYVVRFTVEKLFLLFDRMFLYVENDYSTPTEVIGTHFMQEVSFKSNL
jgi:hypothetical protein